jgi:L-lysine 6-transaminase
MVERTMTRRGTKEITPVTPANVHDVLRRHMLADGFPIVFDLQKSQGVWIVDAKAGATYFDFFSFFASAPIGFNHPRLTSPDFQRKLARAATNNITNSDLYTVEMAEFVEAFSRTAIPESLPHLFLVAGGALGVENALKTAFDWKIQKNFAKGYREEVGKQVIHFREAFHGRSGYTLSLTNTDPVKTRHFPKFSWPRVANPKIEFPVTPESEARVARAEEEALAAVRAAIAREGDDIAALIIEPIQGEGGDNHFRGEFLRALRRICDEHEILFIVDEVQAGLGLTGTWWAYQNFGFEPDLLAFGKKMQVCGILASRRVDDVEGVFKVPSRINSTWGGNLVDMVRSQAYLEVIDEDGLLDNASAVGAHLLGRVRELASEFSGLVTAARGRGLMCAFDLPSPEIRKRYLKAAFEKGVIMLGSGEHSVRFRPALTMTKAEVDEGIGRVRAALKTL